MPRIKCETSPQRHIWAKMHQFTSCSLHRAFPSFESFVQLALESVKYDWMLFKRFQNTPLSAWGETSLDTSKGGQSRRVPCRYGGGPSVRPFGQVCSGHIGDPLCKYRPTGRHTWLKISSVCGWWKQGKLLELLKKKTWNVTWFCIMNLSLQRSQTRKQSHTLCTIPYVDFFQLLYCGININPVQRKCRTQ